MSKLTKKDFLKKREEIRTAVKEKQEYVDAFCDQGLAALYATSGWTQAEIAEVERCGQQRISQLLRFGAFIEFFTTTGSKNLPQNVTERKFRGYWAKTKGPDVSRFEQVAGMLAHTSVAREKGDRKAPQKILESCGDWQWRPESEIAIAAKVPLRTAQHSLKNIQRGVTRTARARIERRKGPKEDEWRIRPVSTRSHKPQDLIDGPSTGVFLDQLKDLTQQGLRYTNRHAAKYEPMYALQVFTEIRRISERFERFLTGKDSSFHCDKITSIFSDEAKTPTKEEASDA
jgi:hypothetical protein